MSVVGSQRTSLADGLYAVVTPPEWRKPFVAGFIVENGVVVDAAPILRGRLVMWISSRWVRQVSVSTSDK
jgi:hypothetical protein